MKSLKIVACALVLLIASSCGSAMKSAWVKEGYSGRNFEKILVIAISRNAENRAIFENTVVKSLGDKGIIAHNSLKAIPPAKDINQMSEERIIAAVKEGNYDGVIVSTVLKVESEDILQSSSMERSYSGYGYGYGYGNYIYSGYNDMYTPDYYKDQKTYVLETRLFDANEGSAEKALVWSGQSKIKNPNSLEEGASNYAKTVVYTLLSSNLVK